LSGQVQTRDIKFDGVRQIGFQEIDIINIVKPITKYAVTIKDPNTIAFHLEKAFYKMTHGRPGPV
jgi:acetolactate synthase I/II/III large subunit